MGFRSQPTSAVWRYGYVMRARPFGPFLCRLSCLCAHVRRMARTNPLLDRCKNLVPTKKKKRTNRRLHVVALDLVIRAAPRPIGGRIVPRTQGIAFFGSLPRWAALAAAYSIRIRSMKKVASRCRRLHHAPLTIMLLPPYFDETSNYSSRPKFHHPLIQMSGCSVLSSS